jgi:alpha-D-xyloside xylohydrolase
MPYLAPRLLALAPAALLLPLVGIAPAHAQQTSFILDRNGRTVVLEPYSPNILRVTISKTHALATTSPGYGFIASPALSGWTETHEPDGSERFQSDRLVVHLTPSPLPESLQPKRLPLDAINDSLRHLYFGGPGKPPDDDVLSVDTTTGHNLLTLRKWQMEPNAPQPEPAAFTGPHQTNPGYRVSATFDSPADEHYFGLGQQQQGWLDLRDHQIHCWHDYGAIGGQSVCVPFMISTRGYGLIWDNPSKTTIDLGFNQLNTWSSDVGDRVSFFIIAGSTTDEIYQGYRQLTGVTHMLPKAVYGYIQSKAIYPTQQQALAIAQGYRDRHLPLDVLVVDFLNMTKEGEMDLDPARWPNPAAMNDQLHAEGVKTLLSVWPHFAPGTRFFDMLRDKGWFINKSDGTLDNPWNSVTVGPNLDTTNPAAANWFWETIRDRYLKPFHFDYLWLDETEPDIPPGTDTFYVGSGSRFYNVYPLFHTASVYEGMRRDFGDARRVMILSRAAYLGAQRNGTVFWSSDIVSTWDQLKRSIPAGLNFTASGMPYWDTDIAGFFSPSFAGDYQPAHPPLLDPAGAEANIGAYSDYPELFVRWFQWGVFQPVMRAHGERTHNEVWSYGKQAEPILARYLRLRYQLLPYIYSLGFQSYQTGAPFMRALFMDFPHDPAALNLPDEYMFGPAFLVAPVTDQGATQRQVYLPAGCDWYNFWTNQRLHGGQTLTVAAPIDTIPLFVRAGSILPLGSPIESTSQPQSIASIRVYAGADADFTLFNDDGTTYAYEKGTDSLTKLHWSQASHRLTPTPQHAPVQIIGH